MTHEIVNSALLSSKSRLVTPDYQSHVRSPSHSPNRQERFNARDIDPLLSSLSPVTTLEALRATDAVSFEQGSRQNILAESIADASSSERALGIRAALAGKRLREWCDEVENWYWPEQRFDQPLPAERITIGQSQDQSGHSQQTSKERPDISRGTQTNVDTELYWGSLPAEVVIILEERIEAIRDDMETLDVEELKNHVRSAHLASRSRASSIYGDMDPNSPSTRYNRLDDFTVIITATIMQALPYLSRLNMLLDLWSTRLLVLRQVPRFLKQLEATQIAIESGWDAVGAKTENCESRGVSDISRTAFITMKTILQDRVSELGQKLDVMLDLLEGQEDRIPDRWIDEMEAAQEDYQNLVVEAEQQVEQNELNARTYEEAKFLATQQEEENRLQAQDATLNHESPISEGRGYNVEDVVAHMAASPDAAKREETLAKNEALENFHGQQVTDAQTSPAEDIHQSGDNDGHVILKLAQEMRIANGPQAPENHSRQQLVDTMLHSAETHNQSGDSDRHVEIPAANVEHGIESLGFLGTRTNPSANVEATVGLYPQAFGADSIPVIESDVKPVANTSNRESINQNGHTGFSTLYGGSPDSRGSQAEEKRSLARRPPPLDLVHPVNGSSSSDLSCPESAGSETFSDMSSPEILDAAAVQFFKSPTEERFQFRSSNEHFTTDDGISRQSSQRTARSTHTIQHNSQSPDLENIEELSVHTSSLSRSPTSGPKANRLIDDEEGCFRPFLLKRASSTSLEVLPRSELRTINVRRNGSYSSTSSGQSPSKVSSGSPELPAIPPEMEQVKAAEEANGQQAPHNSIEEGLDEEQIPSLDVKEAGYPAVENPVDPPARPSTPPVFAEHLISSTPEDQSLVDNAADQTFLEENSFVYDGAVDEQPGIHTPTKSALSPTLSVDDQLTARISSILTNIPASIRLASGPGADAPEIRQRKTTSEPPASGRSTPINRANRAVSSTTPSITLAPAYSKGSKHRQSGDSEIKLYHLHQPGRDAPIKLFVRLVGEHGERVMVRVGGGWADLGEYLKEYASHHGRRSVSDGRFEIKGLPTSHPIPSLTTLAGFASGRSTPTSRPSSPVFRPNSSLTNRPPSSLTNRKVRLPSFNSDSRPPYTPEMPTRHFDATPGSAESFATSLRSVSRSSWTEEDAPLGLAGPKSKKNEISPTKQAWVDGMLDQARKASAEKKKPEFGEIGKAGGTKRLFVRSKLEEG